MCFVTPAIIGSWRDVLARIAGEGIASRPRPIGFSCYGDVNYVLGSRLARYASDQPS